MTAARFVKALSTYRLLSGSPAGAECDPDDQDEGVADTCDAAVGSAAERRCHRPGAAARIHRALRGVRTRASDRRADGEAPISHGVGLPRNERGEVIADAPTTVAQAKPTQLEGRRADRLVVFGITGDLAK